MKNRNLNALFMLIAVLLCLGICPIAYSEDDAVRRKELLEQLKAVRAELDAVQAESQECRKTAQPLVDAKRAEKVTQQGMRQDMLAEIKTDRQERREIHAEKEVCITAAGDDKGAIKACRDLAVPKVKLLFAEIKETRSELREMNPIVDIRDPLQACFTAAAEKRKPLWAQAKLLMAQLKELRTETVDEEVETVLEEPGSTPEIASAE